MITYIYFVKCPDCEDEHFDFFDEAKEFALGCLTKKPIITQTEVTRNDFGECTDHCDLGTVWSWEDMMQDTTSEDDATVFSKNETFGISEGRDDFDDFNIEPQTDEFDNSLDFDITDVETAIDFLVTDEEETIAGYEEVEDAIEDLNVENKREILDTLDHIKEEEEEHIEELEALLDIDKAEKKPIIEAEQKPVYYAVIEADGEEHKFPFRTEAEANEYLQYVKDGKDFAFNKKKISSMYVESFKKPIPEGMTIEQLVEVMEENEDTVECKWCNDLFDKSECRREVDLGWLCARCEAAIKSRGETLTFIEGDLEFLDESAEADETEGELAEKLNLDIDFSQCIDSSDMEIWGVEPIGENTYKAVLLKRYENVPFRGNNYPDEKERIESEMFDLGGLFVFHFGKDGLPCLGRWDPELLNSMGTCEIIFDDTRYDYACEKAISNVTAKTEELEVKHDLGNEYDGAYPDYKPELPEVDETSEISDSHLKLCPECGKDTFDIETGICLDCGFN